MEERYGFKDNERLKKRTSLQRAFVLEIGGRSVLAFLAPTFGEAARLCSQSWFADELRPYFSNGKAVYDDCAELRVREASRIEEMSVREDYASDLARGESVKFVFAFLIEIDVDLH